MWAQPARKVRNPPLCYGKWCPVATGRVEEAIFYQIRAKKGVFSVLWWVYIVAEKGGSEQLGAHWQGSMEARLGGARAEPAWPSAVWRKPLAHVLVVNNVEGYRRTLLCCLSGHDAVGVWTAVAWRVCTSQSCPTGWELWRDKVWRLTRRHVTLNHKPANDVLLEQSLLGIEWVWTVFGATVSVEHFQDGHCREIRWDATSWWRWQGLFCLK